MYAIKNMLGILVIVSVNAISHVMVDKLVDECNENIDEEVKILDNNENVILAYCTLYCFQYSLQLMLELLPILFTTNT